MKRIVNLIHLFPLVAIGGTFYAQKLLFEKQFQNGIIILGVSFVFFLISIVVFRKKISQLPWTSVRYSPRVFWLVFLFIFILSTVVSFSYLSSIPVVLSGDVANYGLIARKILEGNQVEIFSTSLRGLTYFYIYSIAAVMKVFGDNMISLRAFSAVGGVLASLSVYYFARKYYGDVVGIIAGFLYLSSTFHLVFARNGLEVSYMNLFLPAMLTLIILGICSKKMRWIFFIAAGIVLGLSQYFYTGAKLIPIMGLAIFFVEGYRQRISLLRIGLYISIFIFGVLVIYAPMIRWYIQHPDTYTDRINQVSIANHPDIRSRDLSRIFLFSKTQLFRTYVPFFYPVGSHFFFRDPYLEYLPAVFFWLGMFFILVKGNLKERFLLVWIVLGSLLAGFFTMDTPTSSRYLILLPGVIIVSAYGLGVLVTLLSLSLYPVKRLKNIPNFIGFLLVITMVISGIYLYFQYELNQGDSYDTNTYVATMAGNTLKTVSKDYSVYFLNSGSLYYKAIPSLEFLSGRSGENIPEPLTEEYLDTLPGKNFIFIVTHERKGELNILNSKYGNSQIQTITNFTGSPILYISQVSTSRR